MITIEMEMNGKDNILMMRKAVREGPLLVAERRSDILLNVN